LHVFVVKLVQSAVLQHSPTISGWFVHMVMQRISNGAPAQSASLLHAFVQYIWPEPTHGVDRWVVPQISSTASPLVRQIAAHGSPQLTPSVFDVAPQPGAALAAQIAAASPRVASVADLTRTRASYCSAPGGTKSCTAERPDARRVC
jgi:hypothetical protein